MTVTLIEGLAAVLMYLFGGALVLFIYDAFKKTGQRNLMYMAIGFFILIFGSNLNTLAEALQSLDNVTITLDSSAVRTVTLIIQLVGILVLLYSATRPPSQ